MRNIIGLRWCFLLLMSIGNRFLVEHQTDRKADIIKIDPSCLFFALIVCHIASLLSVECDFYWHLRNNKQNQMECGKETKIYIRTYGSI